MREAEHLPFRLRRNPELLRWRISFVGEIEEKSVVVEAEIAVGYGSLGRIVLIDAAESGVLECPEHGPVDFERLHGEVLGFVELPVAEKRADVAVVVGASRNDQYYNCREKYA